MLAAFTINHTIQQSHFFWADRNWARRVSIRTNESSQGVGSGLKVSFHQEVPSWLRTYPQIAPATVTIVRARHQPLMESRESFLVPENSLSGVRMAVRFGYPSIECDVRWTKDSVLVCMHDGTINRTMRLKDGQKPIEGKVRVNETDFKTLRDKYRLQSSEEEYREQIPTFEEMLLECKECGIKPILHCDIYEGYEVGR